MMHIKKYLGIVVLVLASVILGIVFVAWIAVIAIQYAAQCMIERAAA